MERLPETARATARRGSSAVAMRPFAVFVLMALVVVAWSAPVSAAEPPLRLEAMGMIDIAPDGTVEDYALESELTPEVAQLVDRTVRRWRFEPVEVDGRPVPARTRMRLSLEALPRGDSYVLRVADVAFGVPAREMMAPPQYPADLLRHGHQAKVDLVVKVNAEGRVDAIHVERVSLARSAGKRTSRIRGQFADASIAAAREWTFPPGFFADGEPAPAILRVPVTFTLTVGGDWHRMPEFSPGPVHPAPWPGALAPAEGMQADDADVDELDVQRLDPPVRLTEDVVGDEL